MAMDYQQLLSNQRKFFRTRATRPLEFRKEQLKKLRGMVELYQEEMVQAVHKDLRRGREATMQIEVLGTISEIDYFLKNIDEWAADTKVKGSDREKPFIVKEPKGVVLVMTAWNVPFVVGFSPLIAAIASGNTVVIKPSEVSPHSADVWLKMISSTFDSSYITVVLGLVKETTDLLKQRFDHICYTGSENVAKIVMGAAAKHVTPVTLELGGKCPGIVDSSADLNKAAERIVAVKFLNCGQVCMTYDYLLTTEDVKPKLIRAIQDQILKVFGEDIKSSPGYSRIVNKNHFDRIKNLVDNSASKVLFKGGDLDREDVFIPPIILDTKKDDHIMQNEIFGPVLPIVTVPNFDDAIDFVLDGEKPLSIYLFSENQGQIKKVIENTSSGAVGINDAMKQIMFQGLPFGGVGNSGIGRYMGKWGFDEFSHHKAVVHCQL